jgi:hypothetical protein
MVETKYRIWTAKALHPVNLAAVGSTMHIRTTLCLALFCIPLVAAAAPDKKPDFTVVVEYSTVPDIKDWAEKAKTLVEKWYPILCKRLAVKGIDPPKTVTLTFEDQEEGIAGTGGDHIGINAKWVRAHPDDWGMVIHELVHVVQSYPKYDPSWLVEGVADYTRYHYFEPERHNLAVDPAKHSYKEGYWTVGAFLAYMEKKVDKKIVSRVNELMKKGTFTPEFWKRYQGKTIDDLWKDYAAWYAVENPKNPNWATEVKK